MKFSIQKGLVTISPASKKPRITSEDWNGSTLYSIIKREIIRRSGTRSRPKGDNCPMLYAMKNSDGLKTNDETIEKLYSLISESIDKHFRNNFPFDTIVPMPSSSDIPLRISNILKSKYQTNILNIEQGLVKKTPQEMINFILSENNIIDKEKQAIVTALNRNKDKLSIKNVKPEYRHHLFPIFKVTSLDIFKGHFPKRILLVDDIFASGLTLSSVKSVLSSVYPTTEISALTLFSRL